MNILLIGKRAKILEQVAEHLRSYGCNVELTNNLDTEYLKSIDVSRVAAAAYGQALTDEEKNGLTAHYQQQNPSLKVIEGWAPIPELITYQILASTKPIEGLTVSNREISVSKDMTLDLKAYKLNWLYQLKTGERSIQVAATDPINITNILSGFTFYAIKSSDGYAVFKTK
jgi:hypothetical protein